MTKRLVVCVFTLALLLGVASAPLAAQAVPSTPYTVEEGDNLWNLAGSHLRDPRLWEKIYQLNPFLREPGRRFIGDDGKVHVLLHPGEKLMGLEELGIIASLEPINNLVRTQVVTLPQGGGSNWKLLAWLLGLLLLALLAYLAFQAIRRMLNRDAATARAPMVPNGVTDENATEHLQEAASRQYARTTGATVMPQHFTVLERQRGRIWGIRGVQYADGSVIPRRLENRVAYRARVRYPDGKEDTIYMLQECGNDLIYGGISRYLPGPQFRFEADEPAVNPQAAAAATAPATAPAQQVETVPADTEDGRTVIELKRASNGQPNMVRLRGIDVNEFHIAVGHKETVIRYQELVPEAQ